MSQYFGRASVDDSRGDFNSRDSLSALFSFDPDFELYIHSDLGKCTTTADVELLSSFSLALQFSLCMIVVVMKIII